MKSNFFTPSQDFQNDIKSFPCPEDSIDSFPKLTYKEARKSLLERLNVKYIKKLLNESGGNVSMAAKKAGLERQSLQHLMRKYGINSEKFRKSANKI